ncbi:peroxiredoxin [Thermosipho melanesiensis]|uniref:thioredoxin-dependent peroxiredoxin n=2 Tax=Thermosipho melanesiensis TaxID=46541 RepID=A6LL00_THEM4|nr:peroxiredoxin [Thermosipho melanesiensis]ABR30601.1 alkyl hydroperoxide reductase/ Thiol specific antioxidant/ Mal allergen [Thermosipho melanesiensis BI429]APT73743.1 Peroxiredoxin [Thermosipho melanesiensis]OOC35682.1 peroxiredoxin [Thermosipho melanesiensis]OOC38981.1 peroxiredoxin [Thermosipho melanesiensis]OOC39129.1 peroxiredoxin [Thermosipho melanesiensis]
MKYFKYNIGDSFDFEFTNLEGEKVKIPKGKWVVLYFYPKDNTKGCTTEAVEFSELLDEFEKLGAVVIGVSSDSIESHKKFIAKHNLRVNLFSDENKKVLEKLGIWQLKKMYGREYYGIVRTTVLINPDGKIAYVWEKVKAKGHAKEVLEKLKEMID